MKLKIMPGRIVVKKHEAKLKGVIQLPPSRSKLYEIGEVVEAGDLKSYGPEGKFSTAELYAPGDLVIFQLPLTLAAGITFDIQGQLHCFLHAEDILAHLQSDVIEFSAFKIAGRFLLLEPSVRQETLIVLPDTAEEARKENLHFSVLQIGADVKLDVSKGQEVFPDKNRVNVLSIERKELVFVDQQFVYGALSGE